VKLAILLLAALCLAGCSKNIDTTEAVKAGVIKDIAQKVDVQSMDVSVDSVSFREKEADAKVSFRPKGADASQSIVMAYVLERQGDEWKIKSRNMEMHQQAQPGAGGAAGAGLPQGHPRVAPGAAGGRLPDGQLPAGHPAVNPSHAP
jgi:hypothetical protein